MEATIIDIRDGISSSRNHVYIESRALKTKLQQNFLKSRLTSYIASSFAAVIIFCSLVFSASKPQNTSVKNHPHNWEYGFKLIKAGEISHGFKILDSLCKAQADDPDVISTYAKNIFRLFCSGQKEDSHVFVNSNNDSIFDTLLSSSFKCEVFNSTESSGKNLPSFAYRAVFIIQKPFLLKFNGLLKAPDIHLTINHEIIDDKLDYYLIDQLTDRTDSISCSIHIDLKNTQLTVYDYILDYVYGFFDSISIKKDLEKYKALSLRCYKRKSFRFQDGQFTAIIAFDRIFPDHKQKNAVTPLTIRYTVIVLAPACVKELAEAKFQTIIKSM